MKSQNTKSSDELKSEVRQEIHNVRKDIDELQRRLTPGQFIDDAIFYPQGGSAAATFDHLRRNPIGTTFLSLGTLLLMEDVEQKSYENSVKNKLGSARMAAGEKFNSLKEDLKSHLPHKDVSQLSQGGSSHGPDDSQVHVVLPEGKSKIATAKEKLSSVLDAGKNKINEGIGSGKEKVASGLSSSKEKISSGLSSGKDKLSAGFDTGKEKIKDLDNTTFMALGVGLGVLTGASLPISQAEERLIGDRFEGRLDDFNHDIREAMNECSNILKDLVIQDVTNVNVNFF